MLLGGLWYDVEKPTMTTFLYPLISCLNQLFNEGTVVCTCIYYSSDFNTIKSGSTSVLCYSPDVRNDATCS